MTESRATAELACILLAHGVLDKWLEGWSITVTTTIAKAIEEDFESSSIDWVIETFHDSVQIGTEDLLLLEIRYAA